MPPRETRLGATAHLGSPCRDRTESGVLPEEARIETEAQPSDSGVQATPETKASASAQALLVCDDTAGEGPSSLVEEKPVLKQNEDREEKFDAEQAGKLKQELCDQIAVYKVHPRRPLLGLVLTPTRELAIQVRQHIDAVAKFTGEISFHLINVSKQVSECQMTRVRVVAPMLGEYAHLLGHYVL